MNKFKFGIPLFAVVLMLTILVPTVEAWTPQECIEWNKTHSYPHPDCVPSVTPTKTATTTPTNTPSPTVTITPTSTPTSSPSATATNTPTPTTSPTPSQPPSNSGNSGGTGGGDDSGNSSTPTPVPSLPRTLPPAQVSTPRPTLPPIQPTPERRPDTILTPVATPTVITAAPPKSGSAGLTTQAKTGIAVALIVLAIGLVASTRLVTRSN